MGSQSKLHDFERMSTAVAILMKAWGPRIRQPEDFTANSLYERIILDPRDVGLGAAGSDQSTKVHAAVDPALHVILMKNVAMFFEKTARMQ